MSTTTLPANRLDTLPPLLHPLHAHLTRDGMDLHLVVEEGGLITAITLERLEVRFRFQLEGNDGGLTMEASLPFCVPVDRRPTVAEFMMRMNWKLKRLMFLIDFDDGEIRLRHHSGLREGPVDVEEAETGLRICCRMLNIFVPALVAVTFQDKSAEESVALAEEEFKAALNATRS